MVLHPDHLAEVAVRDLNGRLAHLERGLRRRTLTLLSDHDAEVRERLTQLQPERQTTPENGHVVPLLRLCHRLPLPFSIARAKRVHNWQATLTDWAHAVTYFTDAASRLGHA